MAYFRVIAGSLLGCWLGLLAASSFAADTLAIESFTLKNGMQVVLTPNHRVPVVTHLLLYRAGAADDDPGRSGLAHYNEHMMFQGTPTTPKGEYLRLVANHGGNTNAFTTQDFTGYYVTIAKEHLPLILSLEADRMIHLAPTQENFTREREVIIEERRMTVENQPQALLTEEMHAMLYRNHPYHHPIIGWMHEMQMLSREDVLAFQRRLYHPANAVLVVAGDITRAELQPLAEKYYGTLPAGERYVRHWATEPPQRGARHITLHHENVHQPEWIRCYTAPGISSKDNALVIPALALAQIAGGGMTSHLYQALVVQQKIAVNVSAGYDGFAQGPGEFQIRAVPASGITLPQLEAAIEKEIVTLRTMTADATALTRAQTLLKAETLYARDGTEGMAHILGMLVMEGQSPDYFTQWPSLVNRITAVDVRKAAQAILNETQSVTGYLLPGKTTPEGK